MGPLTVPDDLHIAKSRQQAQRVQKPCGGKKPGMVRVQRGDQSGWSRANKERGAEKECSRVTGSWIIKRLKTTVRTLIFTLNEVGMLHGF